MTKGVWRLWEVVQRECGDFSGKLWEVVTKGSCDKGSAVTLASGGEGSVVTFWQSFGK